MNISINAPLAGCDHGDDGLEKALQNFNPRTPCGVRRQTCWMRPKSERFQSTHPLRGATKATEDIDREIAISIHAPLAGCDRASAHACGDNLISIHAPLAGCDRNASGS